jgi:hypothetical protein
MKLNKTMQWILTVVVLVALLFGVIVIYGKQMSERGNLKTSVTQVRADLVTRTAQRSDLETRFTRAKSDLSRLQEKYHFPTESVEITEAIFDASYDANVYLTTITSSLPKEEKGKEIPYSIFVMKVEAEGEVVTLLKFNDELSERFTESVIKEVGVVAKEESGESKITVSFIINSYEVE